MKEKTIFFSYVRTDSDFVKKLAGDLRENGIKIWLDQFDIKPGSHWDQSIEKALTEAERLMVVLTAESVASNNVMDEVSFALEEGKEVIPLLLRHTSIPFRLRRVQHVDFTGDYDAALESLINALRPDAISEAKTPPLEEKPIAKSENEATPAEEKSLDESSDNDSLQQASSIHEQQPSDSQPAAKKNNLAIPAALLVLVAAVAIAYFSGIFDSGREEREAMFWDRSSSLNTTESYTEYLDTYPNGRFAAQAKQSLQTLMRQAAGAKAWEATRKENSVEAYETYLKEYPDLMESFEAKDAINDLIAAANVKKAMAEQDRIWKIAQDSSSIADYQAYLDKYPDGVYSNDAKTIISQLNENQRRADYEATRQRDWEKAYTTETVASFEEYLRKYPNGKNSERAKVLIQRLAAREEGAAWENAMSKNSIPGYQQYIKAYPNGNYVKEAENKITAIQNRETYISFYKIFENNWYNEAGTWIYGIGFDNSKRYIRTGNVLYYYGENDVRLLNGGVYEVKGKSSTNKTAVFYLRKHSDTNLMQVSGSPTTGFTSYWKVVGRTVNRVMHSGGSFQKTSGKTWVEKDKNGTNRFYFTEIGRDDWSVVLRDNQGRGSLRIDIHKKMTLWTPANGREQNLYRLTSWHNN